jgi:hypothetical protein
MGKYAEGAVIGWRFWSPEEFPGGLVVRLAMPGMEPRRDPRPPVV